MVTWLCGYMAKDHSDSERNDPPSPTTWAPLSFIYATSDRQDITYLCYTSHRALAGTRNTSMGRP